MRVLSEDEVTKTILEHGPLTAQELARLAYPVRVAYLALMFGWAKEHGLDNLVEQREILKPMVLRGLEETAEFIDSFWERETGRPPKAEQARRKVRSDRRGIKRESASGGKLP